MRLYVLSALVFLAAVGCSKRDSDGGPATQTTTQSGTPSTAAGGADFSGSYEITSSHNPGKTTGYKGGVDIKKTGSVFRLSWTLAGSPPYHGVGVPTGDGLGVGWGMGDRYGVVVYAVDGGKLHGLWATSDSSNATGTEDAEGPAGLSGDYKITKAANESGKPYTGTVSIHPTGETFAVEWKLGSGESFKGVGIKEGDRLVVGWGAAGKDAGAVYYRGSGASLDGKWATPGGTLLGGEAIAKK